MTNIARRRGDTFAHRIKIVDEQSKAPIDVTGATFKLTVDPNPAPSTTDTNLFQVSGTIVDGPSGVVEFAPSPGQVDSVGAYFYDIQMTDAGGKIRTIDHGRFTLVQDITK